MKRPDIRIRYGYLLSDNTSRYLNELWGDGTPLRPTDEYEAIVATYQKAWHPYEEKILKGMCETLGLNFRQSIIDVYVAPWMNAYSDPMVIGVTFTPDRFIEVLTHELIHRLLTDNIESRYDTDYVKEWQKLFGMDHEWNVVVHIPVHATLQAVFDDVLSEPNRTKRDKKLCEQWSAYNAAWKYVEHAGYRKIINQLQESYQVLGE